MAKKKETTDKMSKVIVVSTEKQNRKSPEALKPKKTNESRQTTANKHSKKRQKTESTDKVAIDQHSTEAKGQIEVEATAVVTVKQKLQLSKLPFIVVVGIFVCCLFFAYYFGKHAAAIAKSPVKVEPPEKVEARKVCDLPGCVLLLSDFSYQVYKDETKHYLYIVNENRSLVIGEGISALSFMYYEGEQSDMRPIALLLEKNNLKAVFSLLKHQIFIDFGNYSSISLGKYEHPYLEFYDENDVYVANVDNGKVLSFGPGIYNTTFVYTSSGEVKGLLIDNYFSSAYYDLVTDKMLLDFGKYSSISAIADEYLLVSSYKVNKKGEEEYRETIYDTLNKKEILPLEYSVICSKKYCSLVNWSGGAIVDIFELATARLLLSNRPIRKNADVMKMLNVLEKLESVDFKTVRINDFNKLDNKTKLGFVYVLSDYVPADWHTDTVKSSDLKAVFQEVFGKKVNYSDGNITCADCGQILLEYNSKSKTYGSSDENSCDCQRDVQIISHFDDVVSMQRQGDLYVLKVKKLIEYYDHAKSWSLFYDNFLNSNLMMKVTGDYSFESSIDAFAEYVSHSEEYAKNSPIFEYRFKKEGGNFILVGYDYLP